MKIKSRTVLNAIAPNNNDSRMRIKLTNQQQHALDLLTQFINNDERVFILKGYAGTGKTTLMKELITVLKEQKINYNLWASTGRAAKILSNVTEVKAETIHSGIYQYTDFNQDLEQVTLHIEQNAADKTGQLYLKFELTPLANDKLKEKKLYIIDESSMIADIENPIVTQAMFGSGRLLKDMLDYNPKGKFIFVGDICQLPPITQKISPALHPEYFKSEYRITPTEIELTQIMRQSKDNDIIHAAGKIRRLYHSVPKVKWGNLPLKGYKDIIIYPDAVSLINAYIQKVKEKGFNEATMICRSNRKCNELTDILRPAFGKTGKIQEGDLLLVTQNNYISGLMNGDMVTVEQVNKNITQQAGFSFRKIEVKELFTQKIYTQLVLEDLIYSNEPNLNAEQQKWLFIDFYQRMRKQGIKQKSTMFKEHMLYDPFLNALRASYGYALTCHKAQGGEWNHVFLDIPRNITLNPTQASYQWVYTAMTRAKTKVHIVNDFFIQ